MTKVVGIDFSGNDKMWRAQCGRSNVWLATVDRVEVTPRLLALHRVQELAGDDHPFRRSGTSLTAPGLSAVAIDAPFSLPTRFLPEGGWHGLVQSVEAMPLGTRPFPRSQALVDAATLICALDEPKPLRATERRWRDDGLNGRSTLWNGPRGGAPFTAACLRLDRRERPCSVAVVRGGYSPSRRSLPCSPVPDLGPADQRLRQGLGDATGHPRRVGAASDDTCTALRKGGGVCRCARRDPVCLRRHGRYGRPTRLSASR